MFEYNNKQRITQTQKDANDKKWYKQQIDLLDTHSFTSNHFMSFGGVSEYKRKKVNYDLYNNILNPKDFEYVCKPFGAQTGELPANFTNRDITSPKVKVMLGMEMDMPFSWRVAAINEEATTRKETEETERIKQFVVNQIMQPIRVANQKAAMQQAQQNNNGKPLTPDQEREAQAQVEQQTQSQTPDEVRGYMAREHQDPAEVLCQQLLKYLTITKRSKFKFNKGFKHANITGEEIYWVGVRNGEPDMIPVNALFFDYDKSPDLDFIEDGEWAVYEYRMTPSEIIANFGTQLDEDDIDYIYKFNDPSHIASSEFTFKNDAPNEPFTLRVLHCNWKSLQKIGFLNYKDKRGQPQMKIVDENYKLNKQAGDISIEWEWIPQSHEGYKILDNIYPYCRPVPGQNKDLDDLWNCKLSYFGAASDSLNSPVTSPMDRMKSYQYFYDILVYRVELLMASDKGKILAANINAVPKSAGIDTNKFQYFMEANKIAWLNPQEEGNRGGQGGDVTNLVKQVDLSLASQIDQYIRLAEYIEVRCGACVGIPKQMEGAIAPGEAVSNTRQNIVQSNYILRPYFELHNAIKGNVLQALLDTAIAVYSETKPRKLSYILDDMSQAVINIDPDLLQRTKCVLYVADAMKAADAKKAVEQLAQAALQTQQADLLDIVKIIKSDDINEAEELLEIAKSRSADQQAALEKQKAALAEEAEKKQREHEQLQWKHDEDMVVLKEGERRKTEIQKQAILSTGFDPNKDEDEDQIPDVLEIAKYGVDADIKRRGQDLKERQQTHKESIDDEKIKLEKQKLKQQKVTKLN